MLDAAVGGTESVPRQVRRGWSPQCKWKTPPGFYLTASSELSEVENPPPGFYLTASSELSEVETPPLVST